MTVNRLIQEGRLGMMHHIFKAPHTVPVFAESVLSADNAYLKMSVSQQPGDQARDYVSPHQGCGVQAI